MNIEIRRELDGIEPQSGILFGHCYTCTIVYECEVNPGDLEDRDEVAFGEVRLVKCDLWYLGADDEWFDLLGVTRHGRHSDRTIGEIAIAAIREDAVRHVDEVDVVHEAIEKYHDAMADRAA